MSEKSQAAQEIATSIAQTSHGEITADIAVVNDSAGSITDNSRQLKENADNLYEMAGQLSCVAGDFKV